LNFTVPLLRVVSVVAPLSLKKSEKSCVKNLVGISAQVRTLAS
jgi:hypothetical protein